jgi:aquaporin Z
LSGPGWRPHWRAYAAECCGTALLILVGLSVVIADFTPAGPVARLLPSPFGRRLLTGALFGGTGALLALSPLGRISGAHLDPAVSWAFWLVGSLSAADAAAYTAAQVAGGLLGALPLPLLWGKAGRAVHLAATLPGPAGPWVATGGEVLVTGALVGTIVWFSGHPALRRFTPASLPPLVALLVAFEAPWSGTSMNPARSLGPALLTGTAGWMWIYVLGPGVGSFLAAIAAVRPGRVHVAKIAHHAFDPLGRFHGPAAASPAAALRRGGRRPRRGPAGSGQSGP